MILIVRDRASQEQIEMMLTEHKLYIKLPVDIERHILAGGGEMHSDCEFVLLNDGSRQENIWGAGFMPTEQIITYDSLINIRPQINSLYHEATRGDEAMSLIRESKYYIEWIAPELDIDTAVELVDLQRTLSRWQFNWVSMWADTKERMKVAQEAGTCSERVLRYVGFGV